MNKYNALFQPLKRSLADYIPGYTLYNQHLAIPILPAFI